MLFFTFPKPADLQKVWIDFTKRTDPFGIKDARICSDHFLPAHDYKTVYGDLPRGFRLLKDDAVPRQSPQQDLDLLDMKEKTERDARVEIML